MSILFKKKLFIHIPKTGGRFIRIITTRKYNVGVSYAPAHFTYNEWQKIYNKDGIKYHGFCFIRHPVQWYHSVWSYFTKNYKSFKRQRNNPHKIVKGTVYYQLMDNILKTININSFEKSTYNFVKEYKGYIGECFDMYSDGCKTIKRTETLRKDLIAVIGRQLNAQVKNDIEGYKKINVTIKKQPVTDKMRDVIMNSEQYLLKKYGYE